jgi:cytochrome c556
MNKAFRVGSIIAVTAISVVAVAQNAVTPAKDAAEATKVIEARQKIFEDMKKAQEPIAAIMKRQRELDPAVVATSAKRIQELGGKIPAAFAVDTRKFPDIKTQARENIWAGPADFKAKADALVTAAGELATVAAGGDKAATMKAMIAMSKTCGSCHDNYKVEL